MNVALFKLQEDFKATLADTQWVVSAYAMALGIVTPLSGWAADRFGIKKVYLISLGLFTLGSLLCAFAPNLLFLILFRVLQGIGGGMVIPISTALLFGAFPVEERGTAFGFFGIALVAAPALGPLISGLCVTYLDWHYIFLINLPIGLLGLFLGGRLLKERKAEGVQRLDRRGLIASTLAFGLILYGFSVSETQGWGSLQVILPLAIGTIMLVAFILIELSQKQGSLVDLRLFRLPTFLIGNLLGWVSVIALFGAELLLPLYLQVVQGKNAIETGLILLPLAIASGVVVPIAGKLTDKFGPRWIVMTGFVILIFNTWQLAGLSKDTDVLYILFLMLIRGVSFGLIIQNTQQAALRDVGPMALSRASALINSSRQVFQSLGVSILSTIVSSVAGPRPQFQPGARPDLATLQAYQTHYLNGLQTSYLVTFGVAIVAVVIAFFLPATPVRKAMPQPQRPAGTDVTTAVPTLTPPTATSSNDSKDTAAA